MLASELRASLHRLPWKIGERLSLVSGVLGLLTIATIVGQFLKRHPDTGLNAAAVRTFNLARARLVD